VGGAEGDAVFWYFVFDGTFFADFLTVEIFGFAFEVDDSPDFAGFTFDPMINFIGLSFVDNFLKVVVGVWFFFNFFVELFFYLVLYVGILLLL
jgi:hypothetical protein